ncbi:MAG: hypothetical protein ACE5IH_03340 [Thermodesulfobacteriota bacterium]
MQIKLGGFFNLTVILLTIFTFFLPTTPVWADSAGVLPEGVLRIRVRALYSSYSQRFNPDGDTESIGIDFDQVIVDNKVFPDLATLEGTFGLPPDFLTLGTTSFYSNVKGYSFPVYFEYGLAERVSLGMVVPYLKVKRKVDFSISGANVGFNNNAPGCGGLPSILPLSTFPSCVDGPIDTEGVQTLLESPDYYYELNRFEDFEDTGLGDIRFGLKHQYLKKEKARLAYTLSFRVPTGKSDDPDNLMDVALGDGQPDLVLELHNDYLPWKDTLLNLYLRYTNQLSDREEKRVKTDPNQDIVPLANKEMLDRDLGDIIELETSINQKLSESFFSALIYRFLYKDKDSYESPTGKDTKSLEDETDWKSHIVRMTLGYSTLSSFTKKDFPLPLEALLELSKVLDGKNVNKDTTVGVQMMLYF